MPQAVNTRHAAGKPGVDYHLLHAEPHTGQPQVHHAAVFAKIDGLGAVQCNVAAHVGPAVDFAFGEVVDAAVLTEMDGGAAQHQTAVHHNAANTTARGAEILAQIADKNGGPTKILAQALLDEYEKLGVPIRQIVFREGSHGDYYYTNRAAAALNIPALTSEFCFIDNEEDQKFIDSEEDWQKQARAQCNAILYYFTQVQY